ncbi:FAD-dependent monooxygenase [Streptomyces prasinus]
MRRPATRACDVVVTGGGRAGLAAGHHLRRQGIDFTVLDADRAGPASATLIGVGRPARYAAREIAELL